MRSDGSAAPKVGGPPRGESQRTTRLQLSAGGHRPHTGVVMRIEPGWDELTIGAATDLSDSPRNIALHADRLLVLRLRTQRGWERPRP